VGVTCANRLSQTRTTLVVTSYHIDLGNDSCECLDWPRIRFCKHVAAVVHFFGHSHQRIGALEITVPTIAPSTWEDSPDMHSNTSTSSILGDVISASMDYLNDELPSTSETNRSFCCTALAQQTGEGTHLVR